MRKANLKTRLMAVLLTLCMVLTFMPETSFAESTKEITTVDIGNVWKNLDATKPVAFTAEVNPNSDCVKKMTLTEEFWYSADKLSDEPGYDRITSSNSRNPIAGERYRYGATLTAKKGYVFHDSFAYSGGDGSHGVTVICEGKAIPAGNWYSSLSDDHKQLNIYFSDIVGKTTDGSTQIITEASISATLYYATGEAPCKTAWPYNEDADKYEVAYECWEKMENGNPVAFWYSDESKYIPSMKKITQFEEGKTYMYSIELRAKNGYTFADNCYITINGNPIPASANVTKTVNGLFAMNVANIIKPKSTSIIKLTAGRNKFTVKWNKQAIQTTGYQIQYSTSSKFKNAKTVTVSKNTTTGKTISKLKANKKYYVRIRTYKTVKAGKKSTKMYSSWSKAKTVKVK